MADRSSERDRRVRQLMGNKNPGFDVLGQAQAEIQDAQSELQNHIALQNAQEQSRLRETEVISQAAGGLMAMEGSNNNQQLNAQAATMNPNTQAVLGKYGIKPSQSQNTQRNVQSRSITQKSGDTTNIKNENITNNKTDIKITQPSIPMQAPVIPMRGPVSKDDSTSKFKAWLSGMFARQQNEAEIMKKEYRKKEWNLGRTTSKLMKKIGEATSNLGNRLDPKNMSSTLGGQLKWLLLIFGATMIGKVWKPAMKFLANLEGGFRAAFGLPMNEDLRANSTGALSVIDKIKQAIGIDPRGEDTTLIAGIGRVFSQGIKKLIDKLQFWFEDRAGAMKEVAFPTITPPKFSGILGKVGDVLTGAMGGVMDSIKGIGQYLGDVLTVAFGGSKGKVKVEANKVQRQAQQNLMDTKGKKVTDGDSGLLTGNGRDYMRKTDYDLAGNLKGEASSTQAMSQSIISMMNDKSGVSHTAEIATGVSQLFKTAEKKGSIVINPDVLTSLGLSGQDLMTLRKEGKLSEKLFRIISVKANEAQKTEMGAYDGSKGMLWGFLPKPGPAFGMGLGVGAVQGAVADSLIRKMTSKGLYPKLVPYDSKEVSADGSKGVVKKLWALDKEGAEWVKEKLTYGLKNKDMDIENSEFVKLIDSKVKQAARRNGVTLTRDSVDWNGYKTAEANYNNYEKQWDWKFESKDPGSENEKNYHNYNAFAGTVSGFVDQGISAVANGITSLGTAMVGMKIGQPQQNQRAAYLMKLAMKYGFTREQAAGIAGNAMRESSMATETAYNPNDSGKPGGGLVGWRGENAEEVLRYARDIYGLPVNPNNIADIQKIPFEIQAEILMKQLTGELQYSYKGRGLKAGNMIKQTSNVSDAALAMRTWFEGIRNTERTRADLTKRMEFANGFYTFDLSTTDISAGVSAYGSPVITGGYDPNLANGKPGSMPRSVKNWLWDGSAPTRYDEKDRARATSLQVTIVVKLRDLQGKTRGHSMTVNRKLATNIIGIFDKIYSQTDYRIDHNSTYCFHFRRANAGKPTASLSNHGLGGAIDISHSINRLNDRDRNNTTTHIGTSEHPVVQIFNASGWLWGGLWRCRDNMHFEFGGGSNAGSIVTPGVSEGGAVGFIGSAVDKLGNALISVGNTLKGGDSGSKTSNNPLINRELTKEQKAAVEKYTAYSESTAQVNMDSLFRAGAKVDDTGIYVDVGGGVKAYVKEGASALTKPLTGNDIDFVARENPKTGKLENLSEGDINFAKDSVGVSMARLFSSYKGKGSIGDRLLMPGTNNPYDIYLGAFSDTEGFSDWAKDRLKQAAIEGAVISYHICPTKDCSKLAYIKIPKFGSRIMVDAAYGGIKERLKLDTEDVNSMIYVGPIIYELGRQWIIPGSKERVSDWQPSALYENVRLTPKASKRAQTVLSILVLGELTISEDGQEVYAGGVKLSENQLTVARNLGLLNKGIVKGTGDKQGWFMGGGFSSFNAVAAEAKGYTRNGEKFHSDDYLGSLGTTSKDKQKYFDKNKDSGRFDFRDGKIYGPSGAIWGEYSEKNGKKEFKLYDDAKFEETNSKLGEEGLRKNDEETRNHLSTVTLSQAGFLNYNAVGDYIREVSETDWKKDKNLKEKVNKRLAKGKRFSSNFGDVHLSDGLTIRYFMFTDADGNIDYYKIDSEQVRKAYKAVLGSEPQGIVKAKTGDNLELLLSSLINEVNGAAHTAFTSAYKYGEDIHGVDGGPTKLKRRGFFSRGDTDYVGLQRELLKFGRPVRKITGNPGTGRAQVYFLDEGEDVGHFLPGIMVYEDEVPSGWIRNFNSQLKKIESAASKEVAISKFDNSEYKRSLDSLVDQAKQGKIKVRYDKGIVYTEDGIAIDTYDPKKKHKEGEYWGNGGLTSEGLSKNDDALDAILRKNAVNYFDSSLENKALYFKRFYNAKSDNDGQLYTEIVKDGKTYRMRINQGTSVLDSGGGGAFDKNSVQVKGSDGNWVDVTNGTEQTNVFNEILGTLGEINKSADLSEAFLKAITGNTGTSADQGKEAAKKRILQLDQQTKLQRESEKQTELLRAWVEKKDGDYIVNIINKIDKKYDAQTIMDYVKTDGEQFGAVDNKFYKSSDNSVYFKKKGDNRLYELRKDENGNVSSHRVNDSTTAKINGDTINVYNSDGSSRYNITITETVTVPKVTPNGNPNP